MTEKELYGQVWDILVTLNAVNNTFTPFSAHDIKTLIAAKLKAKTPKDSKYLEQLYRLEGMIRELRESFNNVKSGTANPSVSEEHGACS
jgi:hypothetical protein